MVEIKKSRHDLLDLIQVAFIITEVHLKVVYSNLCTERLFGYARGEIEGQRIRVLFLEDDLTYFLPNIIYFTLHKNGLIFIGSIDLGHRIKSPSINAEFAPYSFNH